MSYAIAFVCAGGLKGRLIKQVCRAGAAAWMVPK